MVPPSWRSMLAWIADMPKPRRVGVTTGGPPCSSQQSNSSPERCSTDQVTVTWPWGAVIAPYLAALVASSCSTSANDWVAAGFSSTNGPLMVTCSPSGPKGASSSHQYRQLATLPATVGKQREIGRAHV